jgi:hypothetical protein
MMYRLATLQSIRAARTGKRFAHSCQPVLASAPLGADICGRASMLQVRRIRAVLVSSAADVIDGAL